MASTESQEGTVLRDDYYDNPSQLSQLLRQRAGSGKEFQFTDSTTHHRPSNATSTSTAEGHARKSPRRNCNPPQQAPDTAALPPRREAAQPRRVRIDPRHVRPSLPKSNSAPAPGIVTDRVGAAKMHKSFDGVTDAPGDTQPDSQMFRQYTSGIVDSNSNIMPSLQPLTSVPEGSSGDPPTDEVEVVSSQSRGSPTVTSPTVFYDDHDTQFRIRELETSPLKFETPGLPKFQTPALAGRKRNSQGQVLSSAMKTETTPGTVLSASAFFGFGDAVDGNGMSLTQAFNQTQAKTSPIVEPLTEDPVFQRPSPNFTNARHTSPAAAMSSPIKGPRDGTNPVIRSSSEPRADYETMKESQHRRGRPVEIEADDTAETQDSWDVPDSIIKAYNQRKAKERLGQEAARSLAAVSAPTPSRPGRKRGLLSVTPKFKSPAKPKASRRAMYEESDDLNDDSPNELSQPMPTNGLQEDDSPDELSQDIPSSTRVPRARAAPVKDGVQVPNTSSHPYRTLSGQSARNLSQPEPYSPQLDRETQSRASASQPLHRGIAKLRSSRESEIIMDSQPDATADLPNTPRPKSLRFPSSPSINEYSINQTVMNGKTGYTSQVISSSMPPMPPRSSSQEREVMDEKILPEENEGVPSSPPLVSQEDMEDITYDEHAYDEHSDGGHDVREVRTAHGNVHVGDDEEFPVVQSASNRKTDEDGGHADIYGDAEAVKPGDAIRTDDEIPETLEQEEPHDLRTEEEELIRSSHPEDELDGGIRNPAVLPRAKRQSTVPETDALEETQPSFFPEDADVPQLAIREEAPGIDDTTGPSHANSTGPFHTANEQQSTARSDEIPDGNATHEPAPRSSDDFKVRSLLDIAGQPDTQRSTDVEGIDVPHLSFNAEAEDALETIMSGSSPVRPHKRRKITYSTKKIFRSPVKETDPPSDQPPSSPLKNQIKPSDRTPPSAPTQEREAQGALAAARAREEAVVTQPATLKSKALRKTNRPQTPRNGALKPVNKALITKSPGKTQTRQKRLRSLPYDPEPSIEASVDMRDADEHASEADELARPVPEATEDGFHAATASGDGEAPAGELLAPNRVFAHWPGKNYYPATCFGRADGRRLHVRFDDGNSTILEPVQIRALALRPGDQVKVDQTGMKKHTYVVVGFKDKIDGVGPMTEHPLTDRYGYATIVLEEKERNSLPAAKREEAKKHIAVPVGSVYLTNQLWARVRDRYYKYTPPATPSGTASRMATPGATEGGLPTPTFPRRGTTGPSLLRESTARAASVTSSIRSGGSTFFNMAFAITFTKDSIDKDAVTKLITSNGGQVLDSGFDELFDVDSFDGPGSSEGTAKAVSGLDGLLLKRENKDLGFVALISDSHSRRTKQMQALALNIPCLHLRWIHDSIAANHPLHFAKYLLPAGLSTHLDSEGVVRSRDMTTYDPAGEDVTFMAMLKERELLLRDQSVLLITGKSKKEVERKKAYVFLTQALGPANVGQCKDLASAKELVKDGEWHWIYVDGGPEALAEASAFLLGGAGKTKAVSSKPKSVGRKRKRDDSTESEVLVRSGIRGEKKVRVACDEFVIQSLILGALIEE